MGDGAFGVRFFQQNAPPINSKYKDRSRIRCKSICQRLDAAQCGEHHVQRGRQDHGHHTGPHTGEKGFHACILHQVFQHRRNQQDDEERGQHHPQRSDQRPRKAAL